MKNFFVLAKDLQGNEGFDLWGREHILWLCFSAAVITVLCILYCRTDPAQRKRLRIAAGSAVLVLEFASDINLIVQKSMTVYTLPLHLCGLAVFFTFFHSLKPGKLIGNFLYSTCMPGALFALLCPDWTMYPALSYHSMVAFLVHTLLTAYPLMLVLGGDIKREAGQLPRCFALLLGMAVPLYFFNRHFDTNYMFLLEPSAGSPLEWFASFLGNPGYILGYLPMLAAAWTLLYLPYGGKDRKNN